MNHPIMTPVSFEAILISVVPSFTEAVKQERALFQAAHLADAEEAVADVNDLLLSSTIPGEIAKWAPKMIATSLMMPRALLLAYSLPLGCSIPKLVLRFVRPKLVLRCSCQFVLGLRVKLTRGAT